MASSIRSPVLVEQQTKEEEAKNRRVELVLQPNVEEMLNLKDLELRDHGARGTPGCLAQSAAMRVATVDIGTNTVLLLVADRLPDGELVAVTERATITRLGEGVDRSRRLLPAAIARTRDCLAEYGRIIAGLWRGADGRGRDERNARCRGRRPVARRM